MEAILNMSWKLELCNCLKNFLCICDVIEISYFLSRVSTAYLRYNFSLVQYSQII